MVTGSVVSSLQGEPRATHDIDVVVDIAELEAEALVHAFPPPDFYLDGQAIRDAIRQKSMFNLLDTGSGDRVDFWLLTGDPFDKSRFGRRQRIEALGLSIFVSSPEDTIVMKLRWAARSGGSEKQYGDALRVFEVQRGVLDVDYIERWVGDLGLGDLWSRLKRETAEG